MIAERSALETRLDSALSALSDAGMPAARAGLLQHGGDTVEISLPDGDAQSVMTILSEHFGDIDVLVADHAFQVPRLFVSDMDSTMIGQECIDELADFAGIKEQVAAITDRAMRGEIEFASALRERVSLLKGLGERAIDTCLADRIRPVPGAATLVQTLRSLGCRCVLVTGGFHHFADRVGEMLGFDRVVGNRLAVANGQLTGELVGPIADAATKLATLQEERDKLGVGASILATGDGANDVPMLQAADYGIAYRAKPVVRDGANGRVSSEDLTVILRLLGIPRSDWVARPD